MLSADASGAIPFTIDFTSSTGTPGTQVTATTDNSSVTFDKTLPVTVSITRQLPLTATTNASSVTFRITFSENVSGVGVPDFTLTTTGATTGTVSAMTAVSGSVYDVIVNSISGNGSLRLDLKNNGTGITDAAGNAIGGGFTTGEPYTVDRSLPSVLSINRQVPLTATTNAVSVIFRATFSEGVTGVDAADFVVTVTSGTITSVVSGVMAVGTGGDVYDVTISSINGNGTLRLDLKSSATGIVDGSGNDISGGFTTGQTFTIQQSAPTLIAVAVASNNSVSSSFAKTGDVVTLAFTASESIGAPSVTIATRPVTAVAGSGNSFTASYTMIAGDASGVVPFTINFSNTAGTPGTQVTTTTDGSSVTYDKTLPVTVSINRQLPLTATTNASSVTFRVTFSENVSGVGVTDFTLTATGATTGTVSSMTAVSGSVYDVSVNAISGDGSLRLDLKSTGTGIVDVAGNAINAGFNTGQTYTIQQTAPVLTFVGIVSNNSTTTLAKTGDVVTLSFTASQAINPPTVTIATRPVTATAGSGNSYTATYTMASADASGVVPFSINFSNTLGTPGSQVTTTTDGSSVTYDKTLPVTVSINRQLPLTATTNTTSVTFRVTFSENVSGVGVTDFTLTATGATTGTVSAMTAVSGSVYDVSVNAISGDGSLRLDLKSTGTGISDVAGNAINTGFNTGQTYTIQQTAPVLTFVGIVSNNSTTTLAKTGDVVTLSFTASQAINPPTVTIATRPVTATAGSGNSYTATYTMASADASGVVPFSINFSNTLGTPGSQVTTTTDGSSVTYDKTLPVTVSINRQIPATATTSATSLTFRVTLSENVTGVDPSDFTATIASGAVSATISSVATVGTGGTTYDVTLSPVSGNGTLRLDLKTSGTGIEDLAGNAINGGFATGQTYTIQQSPPTLTAVNIISNNPTTTLARTGNVITLSFTASEPINPPTVTIATHAVTATAGSGNSYTAVYTMVSADASGIVPFTINFSNTVGMPGTQVTATTNGSSVTFDKTLPVTVSINRQVPATSTTNASAVIFRVTFSENVNGVGSSDFSLTTSSTAAGAVSTTSAISGSVYDVTVSSITGNGTLRLNLNNSGTGITDLAGNAISGGFTAGQSYTISQSVTPGFSSITALSPLNLAVATKHKPQAKAWKYANQWWCVLSAVGGTKIYRLDGTSWTSILTLTNRNSNPDCRVVGNLVHILGHKSKSFLYTIEYDPALNTYKLWPTRPTSLDLTLPTGSEVSTIVVDGNGRLWLATDGTTDIKVWWSDSPYTSWSAPITIATGITDDDICTLAALPSLGKIGIFWSNQTTKRFGFKTHTDGASPGSWSADEIPASQSALNIGKGMADDHMNIVVSSNGTLYCAAKTGYDLAGYPQLILLVRRPSGSWDNLYAVTTSESTQPAVVLNEVQGKVKVVYTTQTNGGDIVYRESSTSVISFGAQLPLIASPPRLLNYATSSHQTYNPDVVIIASDEYSNPMVALSVLATDGGQAVARSAELYTIQDKNPVKDISAAAAALGSDFEVAPNPITGNAFINFTLAESSAYTISIYDSKGSRVSTLKKGWAEAGVKNAVAINTSGLINGIYIMKLQTNKSMKSLKVIVDK